MAVLAEAIRNTTAMMNNDVFFMFSLFGFRKSEFSILVGFTAENDFPFSCFQQNPDRGGDVSRRIHSGYGYRPVFIINHSHEQSVRRAGESTKKVQKQAENNPSFAQNPFSQ
jgi:hypothetical protein